MRMLVYSCVMNGVFGVFASAQGYQNFDIWDLNGFFYILTSERVYFPDFMTTELNLLKLLMKPTYFIYMK